MSDRKDIEAGVTRAAWKIIITLALIAFLLWFWSGGFS